jgi:protein O-mannosyl-transferase
MDTNKTNYSLGGMVIAMAIIVVVTLVTFWPVFKCDFTSWDDPETVASNPQLKPPSLGGVIRYWKRPAMGLYIPVTYTVWSGIAFVSGPGDMPGEGTQLDPVLFHGANLILHVMSAAVVWLILRRIFENNLAACAGALLFAVHPVQVEPVAWVSGLKDLLSGLLVLVAIWQYIGFVDSPRQSTQRVIRYLIVLGAAGLAMLSKPSAMVLPAMLVVVDRWILRRPWREVWRGVWPVLLVCLPCAVGASVIQHPSRGLALWKRPIVVLDSLSFYAVKLVWPVKLAPDYGRRPVDIFQNNLIWFCGIIPTVVAVVLWGVRRRWPRVVAGVILFLAAVAPTLGFVETLFQDKSTVADHYLYVGMFGLAVAFAAIVAGLSRKIGYAVVVPIVIVLHMLSFHQVDVWQNSQALFEHTIEVSPRSWAAHDGLAGVFAEQKKWPEAEEQVSGAIGIYPSAGNYLSLGKILLKENRPGDAVEALGKAVELEPGITDGRLLLADAYLESGRPAEAREQLELILKDNPEDEKAKELLEGLRN